ncbi:hypothetical protein PLICRDRAFT_178398 [Plicaturopsis crispa FD-325 SS-3]|nr:hypothetical protein PLICRDRAFT_178398 [Plicaturopsis crispa FD-325 SS-3]
MGTSTICHRFHTPPRPGRRLHPGPPHRACQRGVDVHTRLRDWLHAHPRAIAPTTTLPPAPAPHARSGQLSAHPLRQDRLQHHADTRVGSRRLAGGCRIRQSSVGPPVLPKTPTTANSPASISPLDASRRQRSTPLGNPAPSSWTTKHPMPPSQRKSGAGSHHGRAL